MIPTVYIELESLGVLAIVGKSGTGKTSTIRFFLTQLLLSGAHIYVCDPHGNTNRENLTMSIEPLLPYLISAVTKEQRTQAIHEFGLRLQKRLDGVDKSDTPIVLVLDEAPSHFIQCSAEELKEAAAIFLKTANEGRKVGVHAILLLQNVKKDFIGSRSIRSSLTHILFHRTNEEETKLLVQSMPNAIKRRISRLGIGKCLLYPDLKTISIPFIDNDETIYFEQSYRNQLIVRDSRYDHGNLRDREKQERDHQRDRYDHDIVMAQSDISSYLRDRHRKYGESAKKARSTYRKKTDHDDHAITVQKNPIHYTKKELSSDTMQRLHELRISIKNGESKEKAIYRIFGIRKGGKSKNWILLSTVYDKIKILDSSGIQKT